MAGLFQQVKLQTVNSERECPVIQMDKDLIETEMATQTGSVLKSHH